MNKTPKKPRKTQVFFIIKMNLMKKRFDPQNRMREGDGRSVSLWTDTNILKRIFTERSEIEFVRENSTALSRIKKKGATH